MVDRPCCAIFPMGMEPPREDSALKWRRKPIPPARVGFQESVAAPFLGLLAKVWLSSGVWRPAYC